MDSEVVGNINSHLQDSKCQFCKSAGAVSPNNGSVFYGTKGIHDISTERLAQMQAITNTDAINTKATFIWPLGNNTEQEEDVCGIVLIYHSLYMLFLTIKQTISCLY